MRLSRFKAGGRERLGVLSGDRIRAVEGNLFALGEETGEEYSIDDVVFLPPVSPRKVICIGFNYRAHAAELRDIATAKPTLTLKSQNSVIGHLQPIRLPECSKQVEHEAELGIVIAKGGYKIEEPKEHIFGYTIVNDVTARDLEKEMKQWSASKSFPTFCPMGPCIETDIDPSDLRIRCSVNDEIRQDSRTSLMVYKPEKLVSFVSGFLALERGDLIATGTVPGVGPLSAGDVVEIEISGIGVLRNPVELE